MRQHHDPLHLRRVRREGGRRERVGALAVAGVGGHASGGRSGQDEFAGLRTYQRGDTARSIHWKSLPKLQSPMVKQFTETMDRELWLDWNSLPHLDTEDRLSQLTRWVLEAEEMGVAYGLRLPGVVLESSCGEIHQHQCLKQLALYGKA